MADASEATKPLAGRLSELASPRKVSWGSSQKGEDHEENEDTILVDDNHGLYAVADGVTLPYGGGLASRLTIEKLQSSFQGDLQETVTRINKTVIDEKRRSPKIGSTTLTVAQIIDDELNVAHVGDSFGFLIRNGTVALRTDPQSRDGFLTNAIGEYFEGVETYSEKIELGDYLVLATDGVTAVLSESEIVNFVTTLKEPQKIVEVTLREVANRPRPYRDDRSMVIVRI